MKQSSKYFVFVLVLLIALTLVTACQSPTSETTTTEAMSEEVYKIKVGLAQPTGHSYHQAFELFKQM